MLRFVAALPISKEVRPQIIGPKIHVHCGKETLSRFLTAQIQEKSRQEADGSASQQCTDLVAAIDGNVQYYGDVRSESGEEARTATEIDIGTENDWVANHMKGGGEWLELYGDGFGDHKPLNGNETVLRLFKGKYFD